MDPRLMIGPNSPIITGVGLKPEKKPVSNASASFGNLFQQVLDKTDNNGIKISAHAQKRLDERNIVMDKSLKNSLNSAIDELKVKGARDSLILTDEGAFVVNVPSRTMITAMGVGEMNNGIVTNIDSVNMKQGAQAM